MPKSSQPGIPATFNHAKVKYSHLPVAPGKPLLLTADPWSYLHAALLQRKEKSRGDNRRRLTRAVYYVQLAHDFYRASDNVQLPGRGTLIYYGVLNLVKAYLSQAGVDLENIYEHHGLTLGTEDKHEIRIAKRKQAAVSIFHEFCDKLRTPVQGAETVGLKDICSGIPEIHEMAFSLGHLPSNTRHFLPISIDILYNPQENMIFSEISYSKKQLSRVPVEKFLTGARKAYFRDAEDEADKRVHRCKRRKSFTWDNLPRKFANIQEEYSKFHISSILTQSGYRYYCNLNSPRYHQLAYSFMLLFYLGIVVRYRPHETEKLLLSDLRPLVSEAASVLPAQFLYQIAGMITESVCVIPLSRLPAIGGV